MPQIKGLSTLLQRALTDRSITREEVVAVIFYVN